MSFIYNFADTWNAIGTTFNSIMVDVSDGAGGAPVGAAASRIVNLKNNGTSVFNIDVNGNVRFGALTTKMYWANPGFDIPTISFGNVASGVNVFIGAGVGPESAGNPVETGAENVGIGFQVMTALTTGYSNVALGGGANLNCTTGYQNVALGRHCLRYNTTGHDNTAVGEFALATCVTAVRSTAVGSQALVNALGDNNVAVGFGAGQRLASTEAGNCLFGTYTLGQNTTASTSTYNCLFGDAVMGTPTSASFNVAMGAAAANSVTSGSNCVWLGFRAGYCNTTGSGNIVIGSYDTQFNATITTGSNNIYIGNDVSNGVVQTGSGQLNIGNLIFGQALGTAATLSVGTIGIGILATTTAILTLAAATTAKSQINFPIGGPPTSPVDGDVWREDNTNTGLKLRVNGVTKTVVLT